MEKTINRIAIILGLMAITVSLIALVIVSREKALGVSGGASDFAYNYFTGVTSASTTIFAAATTTALYSGNDPGRVEICNTAANPAYLYLFTGSNTTTTLATTTMFVGKGVWLDGAGNTTSTNFVCRQFDNFKGVIRGIAPLNTNVLVNYSR